MQYNRTMQVSMAGTRKTNIGQKQRSSGPSSWINAARSEGKSFAGNDEPDKAAD